MANQREAQPASHRLDRSLGVLLLGLILVVASALRLCGWNWDGGHWLHPDERQIYFVAASLGWPDSLAEALSPASPLNPRFFAYGSFPIYLLKLIAVALGPLWPALRDAGNLHLVGRPLAAAADLGTVLLTYRLALVLANSGSSGAAGAVAGPEGGRRPVLWLSPCRRNALLAAALVSLAVLPVQLAHFYTADTLLTFWVMLSLNLAWDVAQGARLPRQAALGAAIGLALATKLSAAPLAVVAVAAYSLRKAPGGPERGHGLVGVVGRALATLAVAGVLFAMVQPYSLLDWPTFWTDTLREARIAWGRLDVPYTRQYVGTLPVLYSVWQTALWGLGLPLGALAWAGFGVSLCRWLRSGPRADTLLLAWAVPYLAVTGLLHTRYLRYMLPLVPPLCIMAVWLLADVQRLLGRGPLAIRHAPEESRRETRALRWAWLALPAALLLLTLGYALAFWSQYCQQHTWIRASEWIYQNIPAGSVLAVEEWDTPLPLPLEIDGTARRIEEYSLRTLALYDEPDGSAKWEKLAQDLAASDYLIVASRRLYASIPRTPDRLPIARGYYQRLFGGALGFELVSEFQRGPNWLNPRPWPLSGAVPSLFQPDESFVVYDHPRTLIFRNVRALSPDELLRRLGVR